MALPVEVQSFLEIIRFGRVDNTYKMVWGKAIVDLCTADPGRSIITLEDITERVFGYYWNLHIYFDPEGETLKQGSNSTKPPKILQIVLESISNYKQGENFSPKFYEQIAPDKVSVETQIIVTVLKQDVSFRFLKLQGKVANLYDYEKQKNRISFRPGVCRIIADHSDILIESINYRWSQILEDFNRTTPRIASKVRMQRDKSFRRKSLKPYWKWLLFSNKKRVCFQCNKNILQDREVSVDHMIPWSFLYSDDLWNLAFVHKSCNSEKSNRPPTEREIITLQERNRKLEKVISNKHPEEQGKKIFKELHFAIEHGILRKMWMLYCNA